MPAYCDHADCPVKNPHTTKKEKCIQFKKPADLLEPVDNAPPPPAVEQPAVEPPAAPGPVEPDWQAACRGLKAELDEVVAKHKIEIEALSAQLICARSGQKDPKPKVKKSEAGGGVTKKIDDTTKMLVNLIDPNEDTDCTYDFNFCPLKKTNVTFECELAYDEGQWVIKVAKPHEKIPNTPLGPFRTIKEFDTAMNVAVRKVFYPMAPDYKSGGSNLLILKGCHTAVRFDEDGNQIDGLVCVQDLYLKTKKE